MFKLLLFLHLLAAIFAIGPLVGVATTASRALRTSDAGAATSAARQVRVYSYASVVVVILGMGLMSQKAPWDKTQNVAEMGDTWIWLSLLLWLVGAGLALFVVVPTLDKAAADVESAPSLVGKVAASGGIIGILFAVIVFLMVYHPGS